MTHPLKTVAPSGGNYFALPDKWFAIFSSNVFKLNFYTIFLYNYTGTFVACYRVNEICDIPQTREGRMLIDGYEICEILRYLYQRLMRRTKW